MCAGPGPARPQVCLAADRLAGCRCLTESVGSGLWPTVQHSQYHSVQSVSQSDHMLLPSYGDTCWSLALKGVTHALGPRPSDESGKYDHRQAARRLGGGGGGEQFYL